jgi:hypothetical protein
MFSIAMANTWYAFVPWVAMPYLVMRHIQVVCAMSFPSDASHLRPVCAPPGGDLNSLQSCTELVLGLENPDRLGPEVVAGSTTPQLHVVAKVSG